ncbi:DUF1403 family protein [Sulfitobacter sp. G21635-S1]|uniref:DUF1403 family protein n=1 Tax=Sulfitobacter sp. G21635-S1 TaxID=3014043 RepID=UPI002F35E8C0
MAFLSGAALAHLHVVSGCAQVPQALLQKRLTLRKEEVCDAILVRPGRAGALRDAVYPLRPGELPRLY